VKPDSREREPAADLRRREAPAPARPARLQQALGIFILLCLCGAIGMWLAKMHVEAIIAGIATACLGAVFLGGIGSARNDPGKGPGMGVFSRLFGPRADEGPTAQEQENDPRGGRQEDPPAAQGHSVPAAPEYAAGTQGHPFAPAKGGQHRAQGHAAARPAKSPTAGHAWNVAPLPEPPVFVGPSTPGQAAWHLPIGPTPSGLAADGVRLGDLEVRAATMVGAGHRCQEPAVARQDAYALGRTKGGDYLVIAVADGVGQSKHSDLAARVAVGAATRELAWMAESAQFPAIDTGLLYTKIAGEIVGTGRDRGIPDADVCAILITAVIPTRTRADGTRPMWSSWIGDVSLWIGRDGELHRSTGRDKAGLDRNTLHAVLPFNPDQAEQCTIELQPHDRVALMTDGVSESFDSVDGTRDYFASQWAGPPPHPAAFLHSLCYDGPGQTDDRTAVVVWCSAASPGNRRSPGERR
jgi:hypothetical protein